jgi:hypothetical protein
MGGVIRPFEKIKKPLQSGFASTDYVERRLVEVLSKLHFTGSVSTSADGQIQVNAGGSSGSSHPFAVSVAYNTSGQLIAKIQPGRVMLIDRSLGTLRWLPMVPTVGGDPLTSELTLSISSTSYIVLRTYWSRVDSSAIVLPWAILATGTLVNVPLVRTVGPTEGIDGIMDLVLAQVEDGVVTQWVNDHLRFTASFNFIAVDW